MSKPTTPSANRLRPFLLLVRHFLLAVLLASLLGSCIQSLLNLFALTQLTGGVSSQDWLRLIGFDLVNFAPMLFVILAPVMALSLLVARLLVRFFPAHWSTLGRCSLIYFLVAAIALYTALTLINLLAPMPTLIAANRYLGGTLLLISAQGLGSVLFAFLRHRLESQLRQEGLGGK